MVLKLKSNQRQWIVTCLSSRKLCHFKSRLGFGLILAAIKTNSCEDFVLEMPSYIMMRRIQKRARGGEFINFCKLIFITFFILSLRIRNQKTGG